MSLIFNKKLITDSRDQRIMNNQWREVQALRMRSNNDVETMLSMTGNAARTPAEAYREFDSTSKIDMVPAGEYATLTRLMQKSRPVNIGKEVFEYRKVSATDRGQTSISGQIGVISDKTQAKYDGTVVPIHDKGFGRRWREIESMKSDGYDALVDDAREAERSLMGTIDDYLWNGSTSVVVKGNQWLGIKNDPDVATAVLALDLSAVASTADNIRAEVQRVRDILYITNDCTNPLRVGVSREIASNWERPYSTADGNFGTIGDYISKLRGIAEIYEDSRLVGNQLTMFWDDQQGFHPVVGMAISSYALPRQYHNSDFDFVKWAAVGFLAKTDYSDRKCALYAE